MSAVNTYSSSYYEVINKLTTEFSAAGYSIYLVGGFVRDFIAFLVDEEKEVDLDFATSANPDEIKRVLEKITNIVWEAQNSAVFGTIFAVVCGCEVQVTTFRTESYDEKTRNPKVKFSNSLRKDLARRDFTMNAIAYDCEKNELVDPFNGIVDVKNGLIKAVGDPITVFTDDPLRIIRAFRFLAQGKGIVIDTATLEAAINHAYLINQKVAPERVLYEMTKLLCGPQASLSLECMARAGILELVLPEFPYKQMKDVSQIGTNHVKNVWYHTLSVLEKVPPYRDIRWIALFHDTGKPERRATVEGKETFYGHETASAIKAKEVLTRLKASQETIRAVSNVIQMHMRTHNSQRFKTPAIRRLIRDAGNDLQLLLELSKADSQTMNPHKVIHLMEEHLFLERKIASILNKEDVLAITSPFDGNDLMMHFRKDPGPWIDDIKNLLIELQLDGVQVSKKTLNEIEFYKKHGMERARFNV